MVDWVADYFLRLDSLPVRPSVAPGFLRSQLAEAAPEAPEDWRAVMNDFDKIIM